MQAGCNTYPVLLDHGTALNLSETNFLFSHLEKNPHHRALREKFVPAVELDVLQTSKHLLTSKRKIEATASLGSCSVVCPQGRGGGGGLTREWCT